MKVDFETAKNDARFLSGLFTRGKQKGKNKEFELFDYTGTRHVALVNSEELSQLEETVKRMRKFFSVYEDNVYSRNEVAIIPFFNMVLEGGFAGQKVLDVGFTGADYDNFQDTEFSTAYVMHNKGAEVTGLDIEIPKYYPAIPFEAVICDVHELKENGVLDGQEFDIILCRNLFNGPGFQGNCAVWADRANTKYIKEEMTKKVESAVDNLWPYLKQDGIFAVDAQMPDNGYADHSFKSYGSFIQRTPVLLSSRIGDNRSTSKKGLGFFIGADRSLIIAVKE